MGCSPVAMATLVSSITHLAFDSADAEDHCLSASLATTHDVSSHATPCANVRRCTPELQPEKLAFSSQIRSLQRRLAEVRAQRQVPEVPPLPHASPLPWCDSTNNVKGHQPLPIYRNDVPLTTTKAHHSGACIGPKIPLCENPCVTPRAPAQQTNEGKTDIEQLKNENNFLTEKLVEASMESAQNIESFSNNRNELLRIAQDLREKLQNEKAENARCSAMLTSAQETVEQLAAEKLHLAENLAYYHSDDSMPLQFPSKTMDAPRSVHRHESGKLHLAVEQQTEECKELRRLAVLQAAQANATILDMARRNLELEDGFYEACRILEQHGLQGPRLAQPPLSTLCMPRTHSNIGQEGIGPELLQPHAERSGLPFKSKRSSSAYGRLDGNSIATATLGSGVGIAGALSNGVAILPNHEASLLLGAPYRDNCATGVAAKPGGFCTPPNKHCVPKPASIWHGMTTPSNPMSASTDRRCHQFERDKDGENICTRTAQSPHRMMDTPPTMNYYSVIMDGNSFSGHNCSPRSPFMGRDGRYTGRSVLPNRAAVVAKQNGGLNVRRRTKQLKHNLDLASAEMRRMQQEARAAAQ